MTETARTQHRRPRTGQLSATDPGVVGEAGGKQGRRGGRLELLWDPKDEPMIDRDTVRQATVTIEGDDLGPSINTADVDFCPMVTPDGRYLFFSRRYGDGGWETATDADVFWVDIDAVKRLRK